MEGFINIGTQTKDHPDNLKEYGYEVELRELPNPKKSTEDDPDTILTAYVTVEGFVEPTTTATITRAYRDPKTEQKVTNQVEVNCVDFSTEEKMSDGLENAVMNKMGIRYSDYVLFPNGKVLNSQFAAGQMDELGCLVMHDPTVKKKKSNGKMSKLAAKLKERAKKRAEIDTEAEEELGTRRQE
jgi:hypothetical protein